MNIRTELTRTEKGWVVKGTARTVNGKTVVITLAPRLQKPDRSEAIRLLQPDFAESAKRNRTAFL